MASFQNSPATATSVLKRRTKRLEAAGNTPAHRDSTCREDLLASFCTLDTRFVPHALGTSRTTSFSSQQQHRYNGSSCYFQQRLVAPSERRKSLATVVEVLRAARPAAGAFLPAEIGEEEDADGGATAAASAPLPAPMSSIGADGFLPGIISRRAAYIEEAYEEEEEGLLHKQHSGQTSGPTCPEDVCDESCSSCRTLKFFDSPDNSRKNSSRSGSAAKDYLMCNICGSSSSCRDRVIKPPLSLFSSSSKNVTSRGSGGSDSAVGGDPAVGCSCLAEEDFPVIRSVASLATTSIVENTDHEGRGLSRCRPFFLEGPVYGQKAAEIALKLFSRTFSSSDSALISSSPSLRSLKSHISTYFTTPTAYAIDGVLPQQQQRKQLHGSGARKCNCMPACPADFKRPPIRGVSPRNDLLRCFDFRDSVVFEADEEHQGNMSEDTSGATSECDALSWVDDDGCQITVPRSSVPFLFLPGRSLSQSGELFCTARNGEDRNGGNTERSEVFVTAREYSNVAAGAGLVFDIYSEEQDHHVRRRAADHPKSSALLREATPPPLHPPRESCVFSPSPGDRRATIRDRDGARVPTKKFRSPATSPKFRWLRSHMRRSGESLPTEEEMLSTHQDPLYLGNSSCNDSSPCNRSPRPARDSAFATREDKLRRRTVVLRQLQKQPLLLLAIRATFLAAADPGCHITHRRSTAAAVVAFGEVRVVAPSPPIERLLAPGETRSPPHILEDLAEEAAVRNGDPLQDVLIPSGKTGYCDASDDATASSDELLLSDTTTSDFWTPRRLEKMKMSLSVNVPSAEHLRCAFLQVVEEICSAAAAKTHTTTTDCPTVSALTVSDPIAPVLVLRIATKAISARRRRFADDTHSELVPQLVAAVVEERTAQMIELIRSPLLKEAVCKTKRFCDVAWTPLQMLSISSIVFSDMTRLDSSQMPSEGTPSGSTNRQMSNHTNQKPRARPPASASTPISLTSARQLSALRPPHSPELGPFEIDVDGESDSGFDSEGSSADLVKQSLLHTIDGVSVYRVADFDDFYTVGPLVGSGGEGTVALCLPRQVAELLGFEASQLDLNALRELRRRRMRPKLRRAESRRPFNGLGFDVTDDEDDTADDEDESCADWMESAKNQALIMRPELREFAFAVKITAKTSGQEQQAQVQYGIAHALSGLRHRHVLRHRAFYDDGWNMFCVMDLADGPELLEWLAQAESVSQEQCKDLMAQILAAIAYVHSRGLVHRDIKPENFVCRLPPSSNTTQSITALPPSLAKAKSVTFVNETVELGSVPSLLLLDFGLACFVQDCSTTDPAGTYAYLAPELLVSPHKPPYTYTEKIDLWAAGVIMCLLLTGTFPEEYVKAVVSGCAAGQESPQNCRKEEDVRVTMSADWTHVSEEAKDLVEQLLHPDSNLRPSAEEALRHRWFITGEASFSTTLCSNSSDNLWHELLAESPTAAAGRSSRSNLSSPKSSKYDPRTALRSQQIPQQQHHQLPDEVRVKWSQLNLQQQPISQQRLAAPR